MERKLEWLQNKMSDIGDSLSKVEELFQEFEEFEQQAQVRSQVKAGWQWGDWCFVRVIALGTECYSYQA